MASKKPSPPAPAAADGSAFQPELAHVFEPVNAYPGEPVTLHTRLVTQSPSPEAVMLRVMLPPGVEVTSAAQVSGPPVPPGLLEVTSGNLPLTEQVWRLPAGQPAAVYVFQTGLRLLTSKDNPLLAGSQPGVPSAVQVLSLARLLDHNGSPLAEETCSLILRPQSRYLRYLPELYAEDDFMGRFLMLFESFWAPIQGQVSGIEYYFDPQLAPPAFLPWLASWLGLELDEGQADALRSAGPEVPVERRRQLIEAAVRLNRSRGTASSLTAFLELYTGGRVEIKEHRSNDFRLGRTSRLGPNIALGKGNRPHTFTVTLLLPPPEPGPAGAEHRARLRHAVEQIITAQKPAHTSYTLQITDLEVPTTSEPGDGRKPVSAQSSALKR